MKKLHIRGLTNKISSIEQNSTRNDASSQEVPDLEVGSQNILRLFVELALVFWNVWWVEEVEERIVRHLLRDSADSAAGLMLLLLLDGLDRDVLARLPVDLAASAFVDFRPLESEWFFAVDFATQKVSGREKHRYSHVHRNCHVSSLLFGQNRVGEVVVGTENEFQSVGKVLIVFDFDVGQLFQQWLIVRLHHVAHDLRVLEDSQPEIRNS